MWPKYLQLKKYMNFPTDMCILSDNIYDYYNVSQGKVTIPNMDDGEEFSLTDVSVKMIQNARIIIEVLYSIFFVYTFFPKWMWTRKNIYGQTCFSCISLLEFYTSTHYLEGEYLRAFWYEMLWNLYETDHFLYKNILFIFIPRLVLNLTISIDCKYFM